jgi:hypothetical protein
MSIDIIAGAFGMLNIWLGWISSFKSQPRAGDVIFVFHNEINYKEKED